GSGYCPSCGKFASAAANATASPTRPQVVRWRGFNWALLSRFSREHPYIVVFAFMLSMALISLLFPDANTSQPVSTSQSPERNNAAAASTRPYSQYPCDFRDKVSPIDGKPCSEQPQQTLPVPPPESSDEKLTATQPNFIASVSGAYA